MKKRIIVYSFTVLLLSLFGFLLFPQTSMAESGQGSIVSEIIEEESGLNRTNMVVIGDSYAMGYTVDGSVNPETEAWPVQVVSENGTAESIIVSKGGAGFIKANEGDSFNTLLEKASTLTDDPASVEQIVVCGGYNDIYYSESSIYYAVQYFAQNAKKLFPNAYIYIGMISWNEENGDIQRRLLNSVLPAYRRAAEQNDMKYIYGCEYTYQNSFYAFSQDHIHPNAYGQTLIADYITSFLQDESFFTGLKKVNSKWFWYENGMINTDFNGLKRNENGWWFVRNGCIDFNYNGFASNQKGWWYIENGKVTFNKNGLIKGFANTDVEADGEEGWWYVKGSQVTSEETVVKNEYGWWYVKNGKVDFSYTGLAKNANGWWYCKNGKVDFNYNGFAMNEYGWWYAEKGKITFQKNDIIKGLANIDTGAKAENAWWFIVDSKIIRAETVAKNANGWWYIRNGKVDFSYTGVQKNANGWWYIHNGKVDFSFNGFSQNQNGWWYLKVGKVDFSKNSIIRGIANVDPQQDGEDGWWLVRGGKVVDETTVAQNEYGWWYVKNGKVDFSYTGLMYVNENVWQIKNGKAVLVFKS